MCVHCTHAMLSMPIYFVCAKPPLMSETVHLPVLACCRYAIAHAVLAHLSAAVNCRLLFATHYFGLTRDFAADARVANAHMAALVGAGACSGGSRGPGGTRAHAGDVSAADAQILAALVGEGAHGGGSPGAPGASLGSPRSKAAHGAGCAYDEAQITFLYRLRPGACPQSYGLQVQATPFAHCKCRSVELYYLSALDGIARRQAVWACIDAIITATLRLFS